MPETRSKLIANTRSGMVGMNSERLFLWGFLSFLCLLALLLLTSQLRNIRVDNVSELLTWQSGSQWISSKDSASTSYYRSVIEINSIVSRALISIAATDEYELYINGELIASKSLRSRVAGDILDISQWLHPGKNLMAVQVNKRTFPDDSALRYELSVFDALGQTAQYLSSTRVKSASSLFDQAPTQQWYNVDYDDSRWGSSVPRQTSPGNALVGTPSKLMLTLPRPIFWRVTNTEHSDISLHRDFQLTDKNLDMAYWGLSSNVPYELIVNGRSSFHPATKAAVVEMMSIASHLVVGENSIRLRFHTEDQPALTSGGIWLFSGSQQTYLPIDNDWKSAAVRPFFDMSVVTELASSPIPMVQTEIDQVGSYLFDQSFITPKLLRWDNLITLLQALIALALLSLISLVRHIPLKTMLAHNLIPNLLLCLILIIEWFIAQDVRFDASVIFDEHHNLTVIGAWFALSLLIQLYDQEAANSNAEPGAREVTP